VSRRVAATFILVLLIIGSVSWWWAKKHHNQRAPTTPAGPIVCSNALLGPDDFDATWQAKAAPAKSYGQSTYDGTIAFANVDRNVVQSVLPNGLALATSKANLPCHAVLILFGHQADLRVVPEEFGEILSAGRGPPMPYTEMMVLVPFVQKAGSGNMHTFVVRMFLNNQTAQFIGNIFYGYAKEPATFADTSPDFAAIEPSETMPSFTATVLNAGTWTPFNSSTIPNLAQIVKILAMPLVGIRPFMIPPEQCSYFEFNYDMANVRPVDVDSEYRMPFANGTASWPLLGVIHSAPSRAIQINQVIWRIEFDFPPPFMPPCVF
jgi:hypothetical protein